MPRYRQELTPLQQRFVEEYLIDLNASAAILRAGYKTKHPDKMGYELLGKPIVKEAIEKAQGRLQRRTEVTQERIIAELAKVAFDDVQDDETGLAYRDQHKMKALELLGKHLGMYTDKVSIDQTLSNKDGVPLMVEHLSPEERRARIDELNRKRGIGANPTS